MAITKKLKLYEVNPRFFKDTSGNGIGDLKGLSSKMDYFEYLGVDAVILQDILSSVSNDAVQDYTRIAKDLGTINDLSVVISKANTMSKKVFIEFGIGSIKESHEWFQNSSKNDIEEFKGVIDFKSQQDNTLDVDFKYSEEQKRYYAIDSSTQEVPLNWKSESVMENFIKVIRFWTDLGVSGFVFKDFEYLADVQKADVMNEDTLKELRKFYRAIKEIDDSIAIVGKSKEPGTNNTTIYTQGSTKVFDYFMDLRIAQLGNSKKFGADEIGKFKSSSFVSSIKKSVSDTSNILTFGTENTGRVTSRWGDGGQYNVESSKALGMLLTLTPASPSIYYGDEIGTLNVGLTHLDDFQDSTLVARRKEFVTSGKLKEKEFMEAQVLQNPINARALMAWTTDKNGGFSNSEKTITPVNSTYKEVNVANQFADKNSTLNFYKELMRVAGTSTYAKIIAQGDFKIGVTLSGVIKMSSNLEDREVRIFINLTDKTKKIKRAKGGKVVLSTYAHKNYIDLPVELEAFEGIMISKSTDEVIKVTQQFKVTEAKAKADTDVAAKQEAKRLERAKLDQIKADEEAKLVAKTQAAAEKQAVIDAEIAEKAKAEAVIQAEKETAKLKAQTIVDRELVEANLKLQEEKEVARTRKLEAKQERQAERQAEKTRILELKAEKKAMAQEEKAELAIVKEAARAEREAARLLRQEENKFAIMDEELHESDRTTLTEDDIAATTQIDIDNIDDFEAFLNSDNENNKK